MGEIKVYIINIEETEFPFIEAERHGRLEAIKTEAESLGSVYSLKGFQDAVNNDQINFNASYILID